MIEPTYSEPSPESSIDIEGVRKFNWKSGEIRDEFHDAFDTINSNRNEWKIAQVEDDDHPRSVATLSVSSLSTLITTLNELDLEFNEITRECGEDPVIVGTSQEAIDNWKVASSHQRKELKGIPICCVKEFDSREEPKYNAACSTESAEVMDIEGGVKLTDESFLLNHLWNYTGLSLLEYTPHSFDCEASKKLAKKNGELLREIGFDKEADLLWDFLSVPTTWEAYHGLAHIRNKYAIGSYSVGDNWVKKTIKLNGDHKDIASV